MLVLGFNVALLLCFHCSVVSNNLRAVLLVTLIKDLQGTRFTNTHYNDFDFICKSFVSMMLFYVRSCAVLSL